MAGRAAAPWTVSGGFESLAGDMHVCMNSQKVLMDCSVPVCLTFAPVHAFTMTSVPSAGCLLAKNQYYRTRFNSESSVSSGSSSFCSDPVNFSDQEKAHHGLPELFDKCWWIKNFFHSETSASSNVNGKTLSTSSVAS
ncbi:pancreatic progenitor cell differentiation and proliferation factor-like protein isoform X1 [Dermochelys coriacea]|uniref:pancreatic progenitor cell differentiation and proliferation factor-like protein isoform X1 n=1 Tax=Dermochelys coriacea TaxID=27794 RepID=UPI0018E7F3BE|nr:pancreatic progenitor cell differentiation and proliferation factor-like protein isoform X1 [Dermochelys coriacea]